MKKITLCVTALLAVAFTLLASCERNKKSADRQDGLAKEELVKEDSTSIQAEAKENQMADYEYNVINPSNYGRISLNMNISDVPATIDGVYNQKKYYEYDHNGEDMNVPNNIKGYYTYSSNGKDPIYVTVDNKNNIVAIQVTSKKVASTDGIHVGDPMSKLTSDSRFRPSENEMNDNWMSANFFYTSDGDNVTGIFIGEEF